MSARWVPDPTRSQCVLIGASHFPVADELPDIPSVQNNVARLRQVFTDPEVGIFLEKNCAEALDPPSLADVGQSLGNAATTTIDLLLVYYAGHGLLDDDGRLHLALPSTVPDRLGYTALSLDLIRRDLARSPAQAKILVLDCCFSGRAIEAMSNKDSLVRGQIEVTGTYTITSTTANAPAHAPAGEEYTAFTGALLQALDAPVPLDLSGLYDLVTRDLRARGLSAPQQRSVNTAGNLALTRGPVSKVPDAGTVAGAPSATLETEPEITFSNSGDGFWDLLPIIALYLTAGAASVGTIIADEPGVAVSIVMPLVMFVHAVITKVQKSLAGPAELALDRQGLSYRYGSETPITMLWEDIEWIVVDDGHQFDTALIVRPAEDFVGPTVLQKLPLLELADLHYVRLCTVAELSCTRDELVRALREFAGSRLLESHPEDVSSEHRQRF